MSSTTPVVTGSAKGAAKVVSIARRGLLVAALSGVLLASLGLWGRWRFGSISAGIAYLSGEPIYLDRETLDFGKVGPHTDQSAVIKLLNLTDSELRLVGSQSSCSCTFLDSLPATLHPRERKAFRIKVHPRPGSDRFEETIDIFTNHPARNRVRVRVVGKVEVAPG